MTTTAPQQHFYIVADNRPDPPRLEVAVSVNVSAKLAWSSLCWPGAGWANE